MSNSEFLVSAGRVDITPGTQMELFGYAEKRLWESIRGQLEINAMIVRYGDLRVSLVSVDSLYVTDAFCDAIKSVLSDKLDLPNCFIFAGASHTHFAPAIDDTKPLLGSADETYIRQVTSAGSELILGLAKEKGDSLNAEYFSCSGSHAVNRRKSVWKPEGIKLKRNTVGLRPNPMGYKDETIHIIIWGGERGCPSAVLWSYANHPVANPMVLSVSADFPGVVRRKLRDFFGNPKLPVIYFQGFSGNQRPNAVKRSFSSLRPRKLVERALNGPSFCSFSQSEYLEWSEIAGGEGSANHSDSPWGELATLSCDRARDNTSWRSDRGIPWK